MYGRRSRRRSGLGRTDPARSGEGMPIFLVGLGLLALIVTDRGIHPLEKSGPGAAERYRWWCPEAASATMSQE